MPSSREARPNSSRASRSKDDGGRRQILLHMPKELCRRLKTKADQEKRTVSAQAELYIEVMLRLTPTDEFELIQRYRATVGG